MASQRNGKMNESMSRREFMQTSGVIVGGAGLLLCEVPGYGRAEAREKMASQAPAPSDVTRSRNRTEALYRGLIAETRAAFPRKSIGPGFPSSVAEWEAHTSETRAGLMQALNIPEERVDLDVRRMGSVRLPGLSIEKLAYSAEEGSRVTANLYVPDRVEGRIPAFVLCSGSNASKDTDFNQIMGQYLAGAGCLCLVPDTIGEGDRRIGGCHVEYVDEFLKLDRQLYGKFILDLMRAVDCLLTRPEVDPERVGTAGHSLGGGLALNLAALDTRVRLSIPASPNFLYEVRNRPYWGAQGAQAPFGMGRLASSAEYAALVAPRDMLVVTADGDFADPDVIDANIQIARRVYSLYDRDDALAIHRVRDGSGHGPHFLCREAFQFISRRFGFPRLEMAEIDAAPMVTGEIDWYPKTSILDLPRKVFPSVIPPHLPHASHCPETDCLTPREALEPEYGTPGLLDHVKKTKRAPVPRVGSWEGWEPVRKGIVRSLRDLLTLPELARKPILLEKTKPVEKTERRCVDLVTVGLPPVEGYLLTPPSGEKTGKAMVYLHESRTKEGGLAYPACTGFLSQGYEAVLLLDAVASDYGCSNDVYLGFSATAVNVANVRMAVDHFASEGCREITVYGDVDDVAVLAAVTDDRITEVINGWPAGTERVSFVPRQWRWTYWEGTVPGIETVADRGVVLACVAPRPLFLRFQHTPEFTSRIYQLWERRGRKG
jgi:dienelactone hydrolase